MESKNMGLLVAAFIMIVVGASLIGVIAKQEQELTKQAAVGSEIIDITQARVGLAANNINISKTFNVAKAYTSSTNRWKASDTDCNMVAVRFNVSDDAAPMAATTDYTLSTSGTLTLVNSSAMIANVSNTTEIAYTYCPDSYLSEGWSRSVLDLTPGFFALAIMGIGVALFFGVLKNEGLLGI